MTDIPFDQAAPLATVGDTADKPFSGWRILDDDGIVTASGEMPVMYAVATAGDGDPDDDGDDSDDSDAGQDDDSETGP